MPVLGGYNGAAVTGGSHGVTHASTLSRLGKLEFPHFDDISVRPTNNFFVELEEGMELENDNQQLYVMKVEKVQEKEVCETSKEAEARGEVDPVTILLNALNEEVLTRVAKRFGCQVQKVNPQPVSVADGGIVYATGMCRRLKRLLQGTTFQIDFLLLTLGTCDMVLGVQWLQTLGDIKMNFTQLTMEFQLHGKKHLLQGDAARLKTMDARTLGKMAEGEAQLFMYLRGRHFIVRTDQKALKFLLEQKLHTGTQMKWIAKVMQFDFTIEYKKGRENKAVDSLSRLPKAELTALHINNSGAILFQRIMGSWRSDLELQDLIKKIQSKEGENHGYSYDNQQLRKNGKLVVGNDAEHRKDLIQQWHDLPIGGHSGQLGR
ncbi:hypothetical protein A4A49_16291 [Nicotiana attenuata]|uniref:Reverse transcriptase RNase H-like domain-containing protein n=1 Tax=Nicotiana attenuata TaxID=49451 RepID=A0A314KM03_NICAT|nr:hypothetical protein A4A49_16291 [Nicotiana attenuata]